MVGTPSHEDTPEWSLDGRYLLYNPQRPETLRDLVYRERQQDGRLGEAVVFLQTEFEDAAPKFSADGQFVVYTAGKFLDEWCRQTMRSRIEPMKKVARMLRTHRELILNYFRAKKQLSSGVVEGLNNKAKVTMRKSHGFRTFRITEIALYHALGKLPEPQLTHRFY